MNKKALLERVHFASSKLHFVFILTGTVITFFSLQVRINTHRSVVLSESNQQFSNQLPHEPCDLVSKKTNMIRPLDCFVRCYSYSQGGGEIK